MRPKQLSFLPRVKPEFGGSLSQGRRKTTRPISTREAMHVVLRATRARGEWSMLRPRHRVHVDGLAHAIALKHGVRLYRYSNVGNHLHLLVKTPSRGAFQSFLRELAGAVAQAVTGAQNGRALKQRFWDRLAYTRIVTWGRDYRNIELYFVKNLFEAAGLLTHAMKAAGVRPIRIEGWAGS